MKYMLIYHIKGVELYMLKIAICDDNTDESNLLQTFLQQYAQEKNLNFNITVYSNGFLFLDSLQNNYKICFLDIFMPAFSGIDTAKELRAIDKDMHLIFCTSSKDFALDGYSLQASNYLLKPLEKEKLFNAIDEVLRKIEKEKIKKISVPTVEGLRVIPTDIILYVTPDGNNSKINIQNNLKEVEIECKLSFTQITKDMSQYQNFVLISRSILLNLDVVVGMEQDKFILETGAKISIPRRKKKEITQIFLDYSMGK